MTSFGPDFGQLYPGDKTTPNPGIHNQDGPTGTTNPGSLPATSDQTKQVARTISGGVVRDVAVALGNVVATVGDVFDDAFNALSDWGTGVLNRFKAFFNGWFGGSSGTGSEAEVTYVIETIKDAVINGYNVVTFTSDAVAWPVPAHAEMHIAAIGGGQNGGGGGGTGGLHGSFLSSLVDVTGVSAFDIQIGTAGNKSYVREAAGTAHTGAVILESLLHGSSGGITNSLGQLTGTTSLPGSGGNGGSGGPSGTNATSGASSALASGGAAGGAGPAGGNGSAGGSVSAGSLIKCGGAGGGGGGRATVIFNGGGWGGSGGYPGGGGGAAGTGWGGGADGAAGPGAPGVVWIYYR